MVFQEDAASCLIPLSIGSSFLSGRSAPSQRNDLAGPGLAGAFMLGGSFWWPETTLPTKLGFEGVL